MSACVCVCACVRACVCVCARALVKDMSGCNHASPIPTGWILPAPKLFTEALL